MIVGFDPDYYGSQVIWNYSAEYDWYPQFSASLIGGTLSFAYANTYSYGGSSYHTTYYGSGTVY